MSHSDIRCIRRHALLVRLRELFGQIDDAFARGDFETARLNNREVAELLDELVERPESRPREPTQGESRSRAS